MQDAVWILDVGRGGMVKGGLFVPDIHVRQRTTRMSPSTGPAKLQPKTREMKAQQDQNQAEQILPLTVFLQRPLLTKLHQS